MAPTALLSASLGFYDFIQWEDDPIPSKINHHGGQHMGVGGEGEGAVLAGVLWQISLGDLPLQQAKAGNIPLEPCLCFHSCWSANSFCADPG